jgi:hypothetical protein
VSAASVAFKLARRGTTLSLRHAVLIVLIVALPVAGLSAFVLRFQSQLPTVHESIVNHLGQTQSVLTVVRSPDPTARQYQFDLLDLNGTTDDKGNLLHPDTGKLVDPHTLLPPGTRVLGIADSTARVRSSAGQLSLPVTLGPTSDRSFRGLFDLTAGRAPRTAQEITATQAALDRLGVRLGDSVELTQPVNRSFTVVGVLADHRQPSSRATLYLPTGSYDGTTAQPSLRDEQFFLPDVDVSWAQSARFNHAGVTVWSRALVAHFGPPDNDWTLNAGIYLMEFGFIAALVAFIIALLAGSAFSIGARSRQRALAVVAATGASRRLLFALMLCTGAIVGAVAGAIGVGLGIAAGSAWLALTADGTIRHYAGYHLVWWAHTAVFGYAVLAGMIAAAVPAIGASRADTVAALRGTRRPLKPSRRRPVVGAIIVAAGVALSLVCGLFNAYLFTLQSGAVTFGPGMHQSWVAQHQTRLSQLGGYGLAAGIIITQLGLLLCASVIVRWTARLVGRLGIGARLAGRDLARNHTRTVPALGAIMATSFLAIFAATLFASQSATDTASWQYSVEPGQLFIPAQFGRSASPSAAEVRGAVADGIGAARVATVSGASLPPETSPSDAARYADVVVPESQRCPATNPDQPPTVSFKAKDPRCRDWSVNGVNWNPEVPRIVVGDAADLTTILGRTPSVTATRALEAGGAVVLHRQLLHDGTLTIGYFDAQHFSGSDPTTPAQDPATVDAVYQPAGHDLAVMAVVAPAAAARIGLQTQPMGTFVQPKHRIDQTELDALNGSLQRLSGEAEASAQYDSGPQSGAARVEVWSALSASAFLALSAAGVALALARSDGRRDVEVLDAVGAAPRVRRRFAAWQAVMITGIGMLLGALTGTIGAFAIDGTSRTSLFVMPWGETALAIVGTTLVIAAISWLIAGRPRSRATRSAIA